ncbi:MAG TPA: tetratricopeptide repeat protein, partial [Acetobacteraceae bacterium]|nr:tetratricopeptide repeat protein [Acetobacteraceae bacterium]
MIRVASTAILLLGLAACSSPRPAPPQATTVPVANAAVVLAAGDASRDEGRFAEALQIYQQLLLRDQNDGAAQYGVAECMLGLGRAFDAKTAFDALPQDPRYHAVALQGRGLAFLALNQRENAGKALREATELDQALWRSWNALGILADLQQDWPEAQTAYAKALAAKPDSAMLHNNLGYSRLLSGQADAAIVEIRKAVGLDPDNATIQNNLRLAFATKGNYRSATQGVAKEDQAMVLNNVGYVAMQRG